MPKRMAMLSALSLLCAAVLRAQDVRERVEEPGRQQKTVSEGEKASRESKKTEGSEGGNDVTYEQVLADPDNVQLNYAYARAQARKGNLRSAASTLERILMVDPNLPKVRLFYAVVLFRLDNLTEAERELAALQGEKMPESLRGELKQYLSLIRTRRRATHFDLLFGAGYDYDDNRNAAPASGRRLFFGTPITLDSNSTRTGDSAKTMLGRVGLVHDLGWQAGHTVFADYGYYRAEQTHQMVLNLQSHFADAGLTYKTRWIDATASGELNHLLLTQTTFLRSRGVRLHGDVKLTPRLVGLLETAYTRQVYNRTLVVPNGDGRTGDKIEGTAGVRGVLTPTMSLQFEYSRIQQGALAKINAYARDSMSATHTWLLGRGRFLLFNGTANFDRYERPDVTVSVRDRRDNTYRGRVTFGVPLTFFSRSFDAFVWTASYEYYDAFSTIENFSYSNNKLSTMLTYRWGF